MFQNKSNFLIIYKFILINYKFELLWDPVNIFMKHIFGYLFLEFKTYIVDIKISSSLFKSLSSSSNTNLINKFWYFFRKVY